MQRFKIEGGVEGRDDGGDEVEECDVEKDEFSEEDLMGVCCAICCVLCGLVVVVSPESGMGECEKVFAVSSPKLGFPSKHLQRGTPWDEEKFFATHFCKSSKQNPRLYLLTKFT